MSSTPRRTPRPHLGGEVLHSVLPNGVRLITEDMPGSHTLAVGFFIPVGSRDESPAEEGCAHFLEHVLFKGTPSLTAQDISVRFDAIGGEANAYTSKEHTCFHAKVLSSDTALAVGTVVDMLTSSLLLSADVEDERRVILEEVAMYLDDPVSTAHVLSGELLHPGHPLGRAVIGSPEAIAAASRETIEQFWRHHYGADSLVVSAAGAVRHDELAAMLEGFPAGGAGPQLSRTPPPVGSGMRWVQRPSQQVTAVWAFPGVALADPRRPAAHVLAMILGGGMSSRLFTEVREKRSLAYHIDASLGSHVDAGQLSIEWQCAPTNAAKVGEVVARILSDVLDSGVTDEELSRAKGQIRGQTLLAFEAPEARMSRLGRRELIRDERTVDEILDLIEAVSVSDVAQATALILSAPPVCAVVGPDGDRSAMESVLEDWNRLG